MTDIPAAATGYPTADVPTDADLAARRRRWIGGWLLAVAAMIVLMVVIGGLTRLTESGLSITNWRPVTGWLPPLTHAQWQAEFARYKQIPEYRLINNGMTLAGFKGIFWLEYIHRLWGRLIGVAFAVPFVVFMVRRWVDRPLAKHLAIMLALGALQGGIGWWMVSSGLVNRTDVSQYRLAVHLLTALVILSYILWTAISVLAPTGSARGADDRRLGGWALALGLLVFVTIGAGAFVAGTNAGMAYNTFPLMEGHLVPQGYFFKHPWWINFFENIATIQFDHRLLATITVLSALTFAVVARRRGVTGRARVAATLIGLVALMQYGLGIATLLSVVWLPVASVHQLGAVLLLCSVIWCARELRPEQSAR